MAFLTHTEFVLCCCPKNIFDGRVLARSSVCKTRSFLSLSLSFSLFCRVWVWGFLPFGVLGWLFGWVFFGWGREGARDGEGMCLRCCRGCHSVWFERLWVKFFKRDFRLWNPEDWDVSVHLSGELVTCASVTEMSLSQQCFENKILQGSGDSKALQRHLVPFCVDHCFLNHKDWTWLPAPIGIRHFSRVPMWVVFSSIHWNFTGTKKIVKSEVLMKTST